MVRVVGGSGFGRPSTELWKGACCVNGWGPSHRIRWGKWVAGRVQIGLRDVQVTGCVCVRPGWKQHACAVVCVFLCEWDCQRLTDRAIRFEWVGKYCVEETERTVQKFLRRIFGAIIHLNFSLSFSLCLSKLSEGGEWSSDNVLDLLASDTVWLCACCTFLCNQSTVPLLELTESYKGRP